MHFQTSRSSSRPCHRARASSYRERDGRSSGNRQRERHTAPYIKISTNSIHSIMFRSRIADGRVFRSASGRRRSFRSRSRLQNSPIDLMQRDCGRNTITKADEVRRMDQWRCGRSLARVARNFSPRRSIVSAAKRAPSVPNNYCVCRRRTASNFHN